MVSKNTPSKCYRAMLKFTENAHQFHQSYINKNTFNAQRRHKYVNLISLILYC